MVLTAKPDLSIIILNWNSLQYLRDCIASIKEQTTGFSYEILVVDGASFDGCAEFLTREHPDVRFFQLQENVGFARANNHAARHARAEVLLFLNPDTVILANAIGKLYLEFSGLRNAGAAGTVLLNTDRSLQTSAIQPFPTIANQVLDFDWLITRFKTLPLWGNAALYQDNNKPVQVVSGACLIVRASLFQQVGGFNESYFMYAEDAHLCWSIQKAGFQVYFIPGAAVIHHGGGSSGRTPSAFSSRTFRHSIYLFLRQTRGPAYALAYRFAMGACATLRLAILYPLSWFRAARVEPSIHKWRHVLGWAATCKRSLT